MTDAIARADLARMDPPEDRPVGHGHYVCPPCGRLDDTGSKWNEDYGMHQSCADLWAEIHAAHTSALQGVLSALAIRSLTDSAAARAIAALPRGWDE